MDIIIGIVSESVFLLNKMSIYLLFGFFFAGVLRVFLKEGTISKHLGEPDIRSVVKASLLGIPLPLCSCGVLPAALSLKREGASKGPILSFLISTPTTGVDSILATYGLLGAFFAGFRLIAAFITGVIAGVAANIFCKSEKSVDKEVIVSENKNCCTHHHKAIKYSFVSKMKEVFKYAFVDLLKDTGLWILLGILIGGMISYFIPDAFIGKFLGSGWQSMFIMLVIGIPMYVCASGSLPIVSALMLKGLNPGAAFVFLLAGPATNSAAVALIAKELGVKATLIFLGTIVFCSLALGMVLNYIWGYFNIDITARLMDKNVIFPVWVEITGSIALVLGILYNSWTSLKRC